MALPEDFSKIYGSTATGGLTPINDVNYAKGWEFVGSNPPTKNDFSYLQNLSDLKSQWLYSNKLQRTDPFGDIKSDGTVQTALENLGLGDAAKRDVGSGANQIPDMTLFAKLHSGNGYQKLPGGLIIQWGVITGTIGQLSGTYPVAFPNAVFQVSVTLADKTAGTSGGITLYAENATFGSKTNLTVRPTGTDGQGTTSARYIAIGY